MAARPKTPRPKYDRPSAACRGAWPILRKAFSTMSGWRTRAAIGGMALFFLCTLGRLTRLFPFDPAATRWSLQEDYAHSNVPQGPNVRQFRCARSDAGIVIGVDGPGMLEWRFARPGPYPTVIQPFFVPLQGKASRITLALANHPEPRVLARDLPLRNRPLDIGAYVKDTDVFALRFEGVNARLEAIRFFEPSARPPMPWAVILVALMLTGLALWMQDRTMLVLLALSLWGFYLRWNVFATHYSLPLEGDAPGYWSLARAFEWRHLFMTGPREPGLLWVVRAARFAFGDSIRSLRFLGVLASVSWIPLTSALASAAGCPPAVGLGAAAL